MSDIQVGVNVGSIAPVEQLTSSLDRLTAAMRRLPSTSNLDTVAKQLEALRGTATGTSTALAAEADRVRNQLEKVQQAHAQYNRVLAERTAQSAGNLTKSSRATLGVMRADLAAKEAQILAGANSLAGAIKTAGIVEANAVKVAAVTVDRANAEALALMYQRGKAQGAESLRAARTTLPFSYVGSQTSNVGSLRNASASNISPETLLGRQLSGDSAAASAGAFKDAQMAADRLSKTSVVPADASKLPVVTSHLRAFTASGAEAHSMARGLASGFGALWLTWGSVIPLLAGAAISHSIAQMGKMGAQVQHTFETIRVLSDESAHSVANLNVQMLELARTGPFGPLEIAEAMKTLSLAGLKASEVSSAIKDVLNFAVAGTTSIKTAADVMTTVATAFKISAEGYNYVGDVIAKTAAVSKASVESIGESFKTASVVNSLYGASLEDVGVGLALLSNIGVQGSAAGTSLRNMYTDIMGRTPKVQNALKTLGVETIDPLTGKVRGLADIFGQFNTKLANFNPTAQTRLMSDIFSERGGKEAFAVLDALRMKAKEAGSDAESYLAEIQRKIEQAAGFMAVSSAQLALTPLSQVRSVMATLQATLVEGFDGLQPYILSTAERLKAAFNSDEFKSALQTLGRLIGGLTTFLAEHLNTITLVAAAYVGLKVIGGVAVMMEVLTARTMALSGAYATNATAAYAAAKAADALAIAQSRGAAIGGASQVAALTGGAKVVGMLGSTLGMVSRLVPWLGAAYVGWELYSLWSGKAVEKSATLSDNKALLDSLKAEAARLREINEAKALGITLDDLQERKKAAAYRDNANLGVASAEAEVARMRGLAESTADPATRARRENLVKRAEVEVQRQKDLKDNALLALQTARQEVSIEADLIKMREKAAAFARQSEIGSGDKDYTRKAGGFGPHVPNADANPFDNYTRLYDNELKAIKRAYDLDVQLNDDRLKAKEISEGQHNANLARILAQREASAAEVFKREAAQDEAAYLKAQTTISERPDSKFYSDKDRSKQLSDLDDNYAKAKSNLNEKILTTTDQVAQAETRAAIASSAHAAKLKEDFTDYWRLEEVKLEKLAKEQEMHERLLGMSPELAAAEQARIDATSRHEEFMTRLDKQYIKATESLQALLDAQSKLAGSGETGPAAEGEAARLETQARQARRELEILQEQKDDASKRSDQAGAQAASYAYTKAINDRRREIISGVSGSITEAMFRGGKSGAQMLRDHLQQQLLIKPFTIMIDGLLNSLAGNMMGAAGGAGGLAGMGSSAASMLGFGSGSSGSTGWLSEADGGDGLSMLGSAAGSDSGGWLSSIGSWFGSLSGFAVGTPYVPRDMLAWIHEGEKIIPAAQNVPGYESGGVADNSVNITQHIQIDSRTDRAAISMMLRANKEETMKAIMNSRQRGGVFA